MARYRARGGPERFTPRGSRIIPGSARWRRLQARLPRATPPLYRETGNRLDGIWLVGSAGMTRANGALVFETVSELPRSAARRMSGKDVGRLFSWASSSWRGKGRVPERIYPRFLIGGYRDGEPDKLTWVGLSARTANEIRHWFNWSADELWKHVQENELPSHQLGGATGVWAVTLRLSSSRSR